MENRYSALKMISGVCKTLAVILGIVALIGIFIGIQISSKTDSSIGFLTIIVSIIFGIIGIILLLAVSELIHLFIDIEFNTRSTKKSKSTMMKSESIGLGEKVIHKNDNSDEVLEISEDTTKEPVLSTNTDLKENVKINSIIQGRIVKIYSNIIILAINDDNDDILEVQEYPTDKIVDEVWVKIKVKYLYQKSNLTKVVKFIETIEQS